MDTVSTFPYLLKYICLKKKSWYLVCFVDFHSYVCVFAVTGLLVALFRLIDTQRETRERSEVFDASISWHDFYGVGGGGGRVGGGEGGLICFCFFSNAQY